MRSFPASTLILPPVFPAPSLLYPPTFPVSTDTQVIPSQASRALLSIPDHPPPQLPTEHSLHLTFCLPTLASYDPCYSLPTGFIPSEMLQTPMKAEALGCALSKARPDFPRWMAQCPVCCLSDMVTVILIFSSVPGLAFPAPGELGN